MKRFIVDPIRGNIAFLIYVLNTVFWCIPLFAVAFLKLIIPVQGFRKICTGILIVISNNWIYVNTLNMRFMNRIKVTAQGVESLTLNNWYLVISNHQSWVDILVLQKILYKKIPFLKFFLKKELVWVPMLGIAWWALDFPFMKRHTPAFVKKYPHLKGKDMEITRKACIKFRALPVSIMNFVEGTRFTPKKHKQQRSPFKHLLKPKAGGIGFVLGAMGDQLNRIVNVTIVYPEGKKTFWDFLCGRISEVFVKVETLPVDKKLIGNYSADREFRKRFQEWLNGIWAEKDAELESILNTSKQTVYKR